jgi:hypothetical protein
MKYILIIFIFLFILFTQTKNKYSYNITYQKPVISNLPAEWDEDSEKERSHMQELIALENELTRDPATGLVPRERLIEAYAYTRTLTSQRGAISGVNWIERGPSNVSGRTRAMMVDPNDPTQKTIWAAGVGGGLFKCIDITSSNPQWTPINNFFSNMAICAIAYNPLNTQEFYFGTGEGWFNADAIRGFGIWKSSDGGNTWNQLAATTGTNYYYIKKLVVHPGTGHVYAATRQGLFRSTNGGTSFSKVLGNGTGAASNEITDIDISASGRLFAGIDNADGIYTSTTGAAGDWTKLNTLASGFPTASMGRIELACAPSNTNTLYAMVESATTLQNIYKSINAGVNWTTLTKPTDADPGIGNDITRGQAWYDLTCAVDPNNENIVYAGGIDLFKTSNGGTTWSQLSHWYGGFGFQYVHADQHNIIFQPSSSSVIYFANDGGIYRSADAGNSISFKGDNYNVTQFYSCAIHPTAYINYFLAGAQDNGSHRFTGFGINTTAEVTGGDGAFCHIDQSEPQFQFTSYVNNSYYVSTNGGNNFTGVTLTSNTGASFINPTDYDDLNNRMYCSDANGRFVRWNNPSLVGNNHTNCTISSFGTSRATAVTVSPNTNNRVYFGTSNGRVILLDNAHSGSSFTGTQINSGAGMPSGSVSCVEVERGNENHILVTFFNYGVVSVYETINGGTSWSSVEGNLPDMPIRWALFNPLNAQQCLLATELGVWSTDLLNGGSTNWGPTNSGLANVRTDMLQIRSSDNLVIAATHARGLFSTDAFTNPKALFDAKKRVSYVNKPIEFIDGSYKPTQWQWNFGDASNSTNQNPTKAYTAPGLYPVSLYINNNPATNELKNNYIQVLPNRQTPYMPGDGGDFESNALHFASVTTNGTSFERGNSAVAGKNGTYSGANAWVTGLTGNYADNSTSYLYTPNYKCNAPGSYTISFYAKFAFENQYDGFNVEYTTDKGDTWQPLGNTVQSGWNNFANATGGTAFPSGRAFITGTQASYTLYSYTTSEFAGNTNVAFRIVFRSDFTVSAAGLALDQFSLNGPATLLPVSLTSFDGETREKYNQLTWNTASEYNNKGYHLLRSTDGIEFKTLAYINGKGTTTQTSAYEYDDHLVPLETAYYRLMQEDLDGSTSFSNIIVLKREHTDEIRLINPFNQEIIFSSIPENIYYLTVYAADGKLVLSANERLQNGHHLPLPPISPGIYFITLTPVGSTPKTLRLLKL